MTLREVLLGFALALVVGFALRGRAAPLRHAAPRLLPAAGRLADDPDHRDRADPRRLVRLRDRPEAGDHRADLLLPDHRQHARRAALGRPRPAQDDAHARRRAVARSCAASRSPSALPLPLQRREDRGRGRGDRRRVRRVGGLRRGLGHLILDRPGPAADRAGVRRGRRPVGVRDRPLRRAGADRAPGRVVGRRASDWRSRGIDAALAARARRRCGGARRRLRREAREPPTATRRAVRPRARLLRQPRPRRHLRGARPRLLRRGRARRRARRSPRTRRRRSARSPPAAPTSRSPTSPRSLLARDQGLPVVAVAALVDAAAHLADLAARRRDRGRRATSPARRSPPPGSRTRPRSSNAILERAGLTPATSTRSTSASTCCRRCSPAAPTRCSAAFSTSRASTSPSAASDPRVVPVDELGIPTYDELVLVANADRVADDPEPIRAVHRRARARHRGRRARPRAGATEAILDAGDGLDPKLTRAEIDATLPLLLPSPTGIRTAT